MNQRPHSVTVIACTFIAAGLIGLTYHATKFNVQSPFELSFAWICFVRLLAILGGAFTLRGSNWARWLLLVWIAYHVILSALHSSGLVIHSLLLAAVAYFLFRPRASAYFREATPNPLPLP
jgi:ABC-type branched-subunit amino acid transport system permease subunit